MPLVRSSSSVSSSARSGCHGEPCCGVATTQRSPDSTTRAGTVYDQAALPGRVHATDRSLVALDPSRRTSPAVTRTGASARSFTAAAEAGLRRVVGEGDRRQVLGGPAGGEGGDGRLGGGVAVGLALAPPECAAQPEGEDDDGGDDERDPGPHDPSQLCRGVPSADVSSRWPWFRSTRPGGGDVRGAGPMPPPVGQVGATPQRTRPDGMPAAPHGADPRHRYVSREGTRAPASLRRGGEGGRGTKSAPLPRGALGWRRRRDLNPRWA